MLGYSGTLLHGMRQMGLDDVFGALGYLTDSRAPRPASSRRTFEKIRRQFLVDVTGTPLILRPACGELSGSGRRLACLL